MKDTAVYIIGLTIALIVCNDWISITLPIFATFIFFNRQKALKEHEKTLDLLKKLDSATSSTPSSPPSQEVRLTNIERKLECLVVSGIATILLLLIMCLVALVNSI